jgi:hypothetical protein
VVRPPGKNGQKPFTQAMLSISTVGDDEVLDEPGKTERLKKKLQLHVYGGGEEEEEEEEEEKKYVSKLIFR